MYLQAKALKDEVDKVTMPDAAALSLLRDAFALTAPINDPKTLQLETPLCLKPSRNQLGDGLFPTLSFSHPAV